MNICDVQRRWTHQKEIVSCFIKPKNGIYDYGDNYICSPLKHMQLHIVWSTQIHNFYCSFFHSSTHKPHS
jgi:hypothetical protein